MGPNARLLGCPVAGDARDTLVYRVDAELNRAGLDVSIDSDLAADGISDLLETFAVLTHDR